jgi:hypothetical protein
VTGLGEFSPFGRLITLGSLLENYKSSPNIEVLFNTVKVMHYIILTKKRLGFRVARWFIFKPKIPIWVHFGGPWKGKCFIFFDHLEYFMAIWYYLWQIGIVCGHLVYICPFGTFEPRKIWQPCSGYILGHFFTSGSGHPAAKVPPNRLNSKMPKTWLEIILSKLRRNSTATRSSLQEQFFREN